MAELHETLLGRKLIEGTLPDIAHQLKRIADALEKIQEGPVTLSIQTGEEEIVIEDYKTFNEAPYGGDN